MGSRRREFLIRLGMAAAGLLSSLLLAEAGLRLLGFTPERFNNMGRLVDPHWTTFLDCYPTNPRGYFDVDLRQPATRARLHQVAPVRYDAVVRRAPYAVEFHYNSLRFRDQPFGPRRRGVRRVMMLGDSFTEGQGVKEPDTCVRVLEGLLNGKAPGRLRGPLPLHPGSRRHRPLLPAGWDRPPRSAAAVPGPPDGAAVGASAGPPPQ